MSTQRHDDGSLWSPVPGWSLLLAYTALALNAVLDPGLSSDSPMWERMSPFVCLYQILQSLIDVLSTLFGLTAYFILQWARKLPIDLSLELKVDSYAHHTVRKLGLNALAITQTIKLCLFDLPLGEQAIKTYCIAWLFSKFHCAVPALEQDSRIRHHRKDMRRAAELGFFLAMHIMVYCWVCNGLPRDWDQSIREPLPSNQGLQLLWSFTPLAALGVLLYHLPSSSGPSGALGQFTVQLLHLALLWAAWREGTTTTPCPLNDDYKFVFDMNRLPYAVLYFDLSMLLLVVGQNGRPNPTWVDRVVASLWFGTACVYFLGIYDIHGPEAIQRPAWTWILG